MRRLGTRCAPVAMRACGRPGAAPTDAAATAVACLRACQPVAELTRRTPRPNRPVRFFTYLTTGPLKGSMLQFFADSTNFTRR